MRRSSWLLTVLLCLPAWGALAAPRSPGRLKQLLGVGHGRDVKQALASAKTIQTPANADQLILRSIKQLASSLSPYSLRHMMSRMSGADAQRDAAHAYLAVHAATLSPAEAVTIAASIKAHIPDAWKAQLALTSAGVRQSSRYVSTAAFVDSRYDVHEMGPTLAAFVKERERVVGAMQTVERGAAQARDKVLASYLDSRQQLGAAPLTTQDYLVLARGTSTELGRIAFEKLAAETVVAR